MSSMTKSNGKKKQTKNSDIDANIVERKRQTMADEALGKSLVRDKEVLNTSSNIQSLRPDLYDAADEIIDSDLHTLRYDINEKGIGHLLLPPSLSTLLQSDRVSVIPVAGGIFIKSI